MVDIMDKIQKLSEFGKTTQEKQKFINVNEVFYVWDIMVTKLDIMDTVQISENLISDKGLKAMSGQLKEAIEKGIREMESLIDNYGIPFPTRPPAGSNISEKLEFINDRLIYTSLFEAIQAFFPILSSAFMNSTSPRVSKAFKNHILVTMEIHEHILEYGKLKGYLHQPPVYRA